MEALQLPNLQKHRHSSVHRRHILDFLGASKGPRGMPTADALDASQFKICLLYTSPSPRD
eukprot:6260478-Alexandrium_andersonii.AAC.1